jgi:DNA polymerase V
MWRISVTQCFALVDCNNFYASCERIFNPSIENKPVIVLSNNDGCVIARSEEAKALGIKMGQPVFECRDLILKHKVHVYSSNFGLYGDISRRVMSVLSHFTPDMEIYSIDEAFLNLDGISCNLEEYCRQIKARVKKWVGVPVSIGIGQSKTLAKAATRVAKKNKTCEGVLDITGRTEDFLPSIDVEDAWGIGRRYAKMLRSRRINTAHDLSRVNDDWARRRMTITGLRTVMELRGVSCIPLEDVRSHNKTLICSRSFGRRVSSLDELKEAAAAYMARAAEKLRAQSAAASFIQIFLMEFAFNDGYPETCVASMSIPVATSYTPELIRYAQALVSRIYKNGSSYRKVGVMLAGIVPRGQVQENLFHPSHEGPKQLALMEVVDRINDRWGRGAINFAATGFKRPWWMRQASKSPLFTTSWADLPRVRV